MITTGVLQKMDKIEFIQFLRDVTTFSSEYDLATLKLEQHVEALHAVLKDLDDALYYERDRLLTQDLLTLDNQRDDAFIGFRYIVLAYTYHTDQALKAAAQQIYAKIEACGSGVTRLSYAKETTVLINLIDDCTNDNDVATAIKTLKLESWVQNLQTFNTAFYEVYSNRNKKESEQIKTSITALRPDAYKSYEAYMKRLDAHIELDANDLYTPLKKRLDLLEKEYLQNLKAKEKEVVSTASAELNT
ncbi:DUF6261 family protein [Aquimarina sp. W85]|uniref:DUF6261 family protein n=1 Tax=Aquimarina rhodophyticola TaxID=3342246 RepID=UPI0036709589